MTVILLSDNNIELYFIGSELSDRFNILNIHCYETEQSRFNFVRDFISH
jgi:hypothetical protein